MSSIANFSYCYYLLFFFFISIGLLVNLVLGLDRLTRTQPLTKNETIVSSSDIFELGFFNPDNSSRWYVGICYKKIPIKTVVWVANRDRPLENSSGLLKIAEDGNIVLIDEAGDTVWSSNQSRVANTVAQLFDSGNFVLRHEDNDVPRSYLWQSFDYPTDTWLPGMKLGWNSKTGLNRQITSWKSADDPSPGDYRFVLDTKGFPECYLMRRRDILYRSGPWNGLGFSGVPEMKSSPVLTFSFVLNQDEVYYSFELHNLSLYSRLVVNHSGNFQGFTWIETSHMWNLSWYMPKDQCDSYKVCGNFGICDSNASPVCKCMKGFVPRNQPAWNLGDGSDGCVRESKLNCNNLADYREWIWENMKLPASSSAFFDPSMSLGACVEMCRKNCSCTAYTYSNISFGGHGCVIWTYDLLDLRQYEAAEGGQDLFVRGAYSDSDQKGNFPPLKSGSSGISGGAIAGISVTAVFGASFLAVCFYALFYRNRKFSEMPFLHAESYDQNHEHMHGPGPLEKTTESGSLAIGNSPRLNGITVDRSIEFSYEELAYATDDFSLSNKIGQGGFGSVFYGELRGEKAAIKQMDMQASKEFLAELKVLTRVHHLNLVRLIGYCVEGSLFLVYEYIENGNLTRHLRGSDREPLPWATRVQIALDAARGLEYIHEHTNPVYIHRDIKSANILIDKNFQAKVADFGLTKLTEVGSASLHARLEVGSASPHTRLVGTFGYMPPEYGRSGKVSPKIDVYAFGVVLYELISAREVIIKVNEEWKGLVALFEDSFNQPDPREALGKLVDPRLGDDYPTEPLHKMSQLARACTHENPQLRPSMRSIVVALMTLSSTAEY